MPLLFTDIGPGEIMILVFVSLIFGAGIYVGIRLYRWNAKDRDRLKKKNEE